MSENALIAPVAAEDADKESKAVSADIQCKPGKRGRKGRKYRKSQKSMQKNSTSATVSSGMQVNMSELFSVELSLATLLGLDSWAETILHNRQKLMEGQLVTFVVNEAPAASEERAKLNRSLRRLAKEIRGLAWGVEDKKGCTEVFFHAADVQLFRQWCDKTLSATPPMLPEFGKEFDSGDAPFSSIK